MLIQIQCLPTQFGTKSQTANMCAHIFETRFHFGFVGHAHCVQCSTSHREHTIPILVYISMSVCVCDWWSAAPPAQSYLCGTSAIQRRRRHTLGSLVWRDLAQCNARDVCVCVTRAYAHSVAPSVGQAHWAGSLSDSARFTESMKERRSVPNTIVNGLNSCMYAVPKNRLLL